MSVDLTESLTSILLEQPPSVRRQNSALPDVAWIIPQYVVGPENEQLRYLFADEQLTQLANLSPIVFYGDAGTGKTALAVTLAVRWSRFTEQRPLTFTTGQSFAFDFVEAVQADDVEHFRRRHRLCKLLVLDDLEPLSTKSACQDELVNTLDVMLESDRPVIITLKRLPSSIRGIRPSLASRLSAGFSIELQHPGSLARSAIVRELIKLTDPGLPADDIRDFVESLHSRIKVRQLRDLISLASQQRKLTGKVDFNQLRFYRRQQQLDTAPKLISIAKSVARRFQIRLADMRGPTRQANVVRARGLAILLARKLTSLSLQDIGKYFGDRDHSTVIHACRKIELLVDQDADLALALSELQQDLLRGIFVED